MAGAMPLINAKVHRMHTLQVIKQACTDAAEEREENVPTWRAAYVSVVDPLSVLEMAALIEAMLPVVEKADPELAARVREAIG